MAGAKRGLRDARDRSLDLVHPGTTTPGRPLLSPQKVTRQRVDAAVAFPWQVCAARGLLHGQNSRKIRFALDLERVELSDDDRNPSFGVCSGWTDVGCDMATRFANDDIFFLEVCIFSHICSNNEHLFEMNTGEDFECDLSFDGFTRLRDLLLAGPSA